MKKMTNKKGFTLAELLIVVAIIAVLVAIAIPVFTSQLEKSREATDMANVRAAYAEVVSKYLTDNDGKTSFTASVTAKQVESGWQNTANGKLMARIDGVEKSVTVPGSVTAGHKWTVSISADGKTIKVDAKS